MPAIFLIELILISGSVLSFAGLYVSNEKAPLYLMVCMSVLAFFYLFSAFYKIFLGILGKSNDFSFISVFAYFALSFITTGIFASVFVFPVSRTVIVIGLISSIGCLAVISIRRRQLIETTGKIELPAMLSRLVLFSLFSFLILRSSSINYYKIFGPLKKDKHAIELLESCSIRDENCEEFYSYQSKTMSERWN